MEVWCGGDSGNKLTKSAESWESLAQGTPQVHSILEKVD